MTTTSDDDWPFFPQQFGTGSAYDLRDATWVPPRLHGLRSVKNTAGGMRKAPSPPEPAPAPIGFAIPVARE